MIWAVVVTQCRPDDLRRCLRALAAQSRRPDRILVVDNAGTGDLKADVPEGVDLLPVGYNSGSAGGQKAGWERAFGAGATAVWAMDDDCEPDPRALEILLDHSCGHPDSVLTCLVQDRKTGLMGPLVRALPGVPHRPRAGDVILSKDNLVPTDLRDGIFWNWGHFFLGTLVPATVFRSVGPVETRYFLRGEDYEYLLRCLRLASVGVVMDSVMNHPMNHLRSEFGPKNLLELRNHVQIDRKYFPSWRTAVPSMMLRVLRDVFRHPRFAVGIAKAYWGGITERF